MMRAMTLEEGQVATSSSVEETACRTRSRDGEPEQGRSLLLPEDALQAKGKLYSTRTRRKS